MKSIVSFIFFSIISVPNFLFGQYELLDSTFNLDGMVTTDIGTNTDIIFSIAIQSDGKIVAAGSAKINGVSQFAVLRYNTNGSLDNTFGAGGIVTTSINGLADGAAAVAIQADGKIVAGGYTFKSNIDFAVVRYNADGTLDTSFDTDGIASAPVGSGNDVARCMVIQGDGKIVLAGKVIVGSVLNFGLARFNTNGSLDNTFDTDGVLTTAFGFSAADQADCMSIGLQADGKIVATGDFIPNSGNDGIPMARYNIDGSLDNTFGTSGKTIAHFGGEFNIGKALVIQPDGKIVVTSEQKLLSSNNYDVVLCRFNNDGTDDSSFGTNGVAISDLYTKDDRPSCMTLQPDGKILVSGYTWVGTSFPDFFVARYLTNGSLDNSFGTTGRIWTDFGTGTNTVSSIAVQADGKIVVGGAINAGTPTSDFALARYIPSIATNLANKVKNVNFLKIYPNPSSSNVIIEYSSEFENSTLKIYNLQGALVKTINNGFAHTVFITRENLASGTYFIQLLQDGEILATEKLLIED